MKIRRATPFTLLLLVALAAVAEQPVTLDQATHPMLLFKTTTPGVYLEAPTVRTEIDLQVRGIIARAVVKQTFENATDHCVEAIYAFPIAENATVDAMRMRIGARTIEGVIKERAVAAVEYAQAKQQGQQ
ncbi:MAG TPA: VIT domain-containing protein, partial [Thermoanaerobaculia bacterium]|nr:VIT domain-containing protein [Thermoanaerobaculia bacterium]